MGYKLGNDPGVIIHDTGSSVISFVDPSPGNRHWEEYQQWLAAGNTPEPADPLPPPVEPRPSIEDRLEAVELIVDLGLMEGLL